MAAAERVPLLVRASSSFRALQRSLSTPALEDDDLGFLATPLPGSLPLPLDVIIQALTYLPETDVVAFESTSKAHQSALRGSTVLWGSLLARDFGGATGSAAATAAHPIERVGLALGMVPSGDQSLPRIAYVQRRRELRRRLLSAKAAQEREAEAAMKQLKLSYVSIAPLLQLCPKSIWRRPSIDLNRLTAVMAVLPVLLFAMMAYFLPSLGNAVTTAVARAFWEAIPVSIVASFFYVLPARMFRPFLMAVFWWVIIGVVTAAYCFYMKPLLWTLFLFVVRQVPAAGGVAVYFFQFGIIADWRNGVHTSRRNLALASSGPFILEAAVYLLHTLLPWLLPLAPVLTCILQWVARVALVGISAATLHSCRHYGINHRRTKEVSLCLVVLLEFLFMCVFVRGLPPIWQVASWWRPFTACLQALWIAVYVVREFTFTAILGYGVVEAGVACVSITSYTPPRRNMSKARRLLERKMMFVGVFFVFTCIEVAVAWLFPMAGVQRSSLFNVFLES